MIETYVTKVVASILDLTMLIFGISAVGLLLDIHSYRFLQISYFYTKIV